jgi:D-sedoheptulose 7-phosphate isomerase
VDRAKLLETVEESARLSREFFEKEAESVLRAGRLLTEALREKKKLLIFGNGGSAADAQHFSAELVNRYRRDRPGLPALALTTDSSTLTSIANDTDYEHVFSRQIEALGLSGDVAIAISTSGNSPNVVRGAAVARSMGLRTLGLAGRDGGKLVSEVELCLTVRHSETARIQEVHALLIHLFCEMIEVELYPASGAR